MFSPPKKYPCAFIPDGHNETAYIAGIEGLHPPVTFTYRPMRAAEGIERYQSLLKAEPKFRASLVITTLSETLRSWDITDPAGAAVIPTADNMAKLNQVVANTMAHIAMGVLESQQPPAAPWSVEAAQVAVTAAENGSTIGQARERVDAGNS